MNFVDRLYLKKTIQIITRKNDYLGQKKYENISFFLNMRLFSSIILFVFVLISFNYGYILAAIAVIIYYFGIEFIFFDLPIIKREKKLLEEALVFFEVLEVNAQLDSHLVQILLSVCDSYRCDLSLQIKDMIIEVQKGKEIDKALIDLKRKIPSKEINLILVNIFQSGIYQKNVKELLQNQIISLKRSIQTKMKYQILKTYLYLLIFTFLILIPIIVIFVNPNLILS